MSAWALGRLRPSSTGYGAERVIGPARALHRARPMGCPDFGPEPLAPLRTLRLPIDQECLRTRGAGPAGETYCVLALQKPPFPLKAAKHCWKVVNPQFWLPKPA